MKATTKRRGYVPPRWMPPVPSPEQVAAVEGRFFPYRFPRLVVAQMFLAGAIFLAGMLLLLAVLMGAMFDAAFQRFAAAFEKRADAIYGRPRAGV